MDHKTQKSFSKIVQSLKKRLNLALWAEKFVSPLGLLLGTLATFLIILKMLLPDYTDYSLFLLILLPVFGIYAFIMCKRLNIFFREPEVIEVIDHLYRDDGSVTAFYENPSLPHNPEFYEGVAEDVKKSLPRLSPVFYGKKIIPPLVFLLVATLIPPRISASAKREQEIVTTLTKPLVSKMEENSDLFTEEERESLERKIQEIRQDRRGISREKLEAVEEMQERIDNTIKKKEQSVENMLSEVAEIAQEASNMADSNANAPINENMKSMLENLSLKKKSSQLSSSKQGELEQMLKNLPDAKNISDLEMKLKKLQQCLGSCCNGVSIDECGRMGEGKGENGKIPSRGGIDRGRGDAAMMWGDEKKLPGAKFDQRDLQNKFFNPEDLVSLGITPVEPEPDPGKFSPGTLKDFGKVQGSQINRTRISPSQKDVISKYFSK